VRLTLNSDLDPAENGGKDICAKKGVNKNFLWREVAKVHREVEVRDKGGTNCRACRCRTDLKGGKEPKGRFVRSLGVLFFHRVAAGRGYMTWREGGKRKGTRRKTGVAIRKKKNCREKRTQEKAYFQGGRVGVVTEKNPRIPLEVARNTSEVWKTGGGRGGSGKKPILRVSGGTAEGRNQTGGAETGGAPRWNLEERGGEK